jgi:hypothetical protein
MAEIAPWKQPDLQIGTYRPNLSGGFRDLNDHGDVQGGRAPRASLTGLDARKLPFQVDLGWHRVGADRAVYLPLGMVLYECFHGFCASLHPTRFSKQWLCQFRKDS